MPMTATSPAGATFVRVALRRRAAVRLSAGDPALDFACRLR